MNNERQETVSDIVREMRIGDLCAGDTTSSRPEYINDFLAGYADRIEAAYKREREAGAEAAHKREVAELRECLRDAVTEVCNRLEKCGFKEPCVFKTCYVQKWRKALQYEVGAK